MKRLIGFLIGVAAGAVQFWVLTKFTRLVVTPGGRMTKMALFGLLQFFIPVAVLIAVAFLYKSFLLLTACGIVAVLIIGAVAKVVLSRKTKGGEEKDA